MKKIICVLMMLAFNAFSMQGDFSSHEFKTFLLTLLGKQDDQFTVELVGEKIVVHGESNELKRIKNELDRAFGDRNILAHNIGYQLANTTDDQLPGSEKCNVGNLKEGVGKLRDFIGNIFEEICVDVKGLFNEKSGAYFEDGKIFSKVFIPSLRANLEDYRNSILSYFLERTPQEIARAWDDPNYCLQAPAERINQENFSHVCGLVSQCFDIIEYESGNAQLKVDLGRIFQFSHRPHVVLKSDGQNDVIEISLNHLLSHIKQLIAGDVLLRLVTHENQTKIIPIIIQEKILTQKIVHYFIIDESGSMQSCWEDLVKQFSNYISLLKNEGEFYLVLFNDVTNIYGPFTNKKQLHDILAQRSPSKNTRLFGTIIRVLEHIEKNIQTDEVRVTLFTDGCNSRDRFPETKSHVETKLLNMPEEQRPYPLIIGLGENLDNDALSSLAKNCGGQYYTIKTIKNLTILDKHAGKMSHKRTLIKFFSKLNQQIVQDFRVNCHSDTNSVVIPPVILSIRDGSNIEVGGENIVLLNEAPVNEANTDDQIKILEADALSFAKNQRESIDARVDFLKNLKVKLEELGDAAPQLAMENAQARIQKYIQVLESAKNSVELERSIPDLLAFISGVY